MPISISGNDPNIPSEIVLSSSGLTIGQSVPFSDSNGALTLQNIDALDATTETTITQAIGALTEADVVDLPNLATIQSHTVTLTGDFVRAGAHSLTLTTTGATNVTLPTSGTLVNTAVTSLTALGTVSTALTGVLRADSGVLSVDTNVTDIVSAADTTTAGKIEVATAAETTTGTDAGRAVSPDGLAGSDYGIRLVQAQIVEGATNNATGDGVNNYRFFVPAQLNGYNLVVAHAAVVTAGTTNTMDIQIHNVTQAADMLTTKITIDSGEKTSYTAATPPVIDGNNDDVATGDEIRIDIDAIHTTPAKGLSIILGFQLP